VNRGAIILSVVVLLAVSGCRKGEKAAPGLDAANKVAVRAVRLYFESPQMLLVSESRSLSLPESSAAAVPVVLRELMKGPEGSGLRIWPEDTVVRGAYLLPGGTAVVDLGGPTFAEGWGAGTHQELMAIHSAVQTLAANFEGVRQVRFVVNGMPAETLAGHISLARSHGPDPTLVDPASR
jgi:spore germination protein GerM